MLWPHCKVNLEEKIDYDRTEDHEMECTGCNKPLQVTYDYYIEDNTERVIDIFELSKKGE